jgi:ElaA protein
MTPGELYQWLALRQQIFVLEQQCLFPDMDGRDTEALHLLGGFGDAVQAGLRIFPPIEKGVWHIGRIVLAPTVRGQGYAHEMIRMAIAHCHAVAPDATIEIEAQTGLQSWYGQFGFTAVSRPFILDGLSHVRMHYSP